MFLLIVKFHTCSSVQYNITAQPIYIEINENSMYIQSHCLLQIRYCQNNKSSINCQQDIIIAFEHNIIGNKLENNQTNIDITYNTVEIQLQEECQENQSVNITNSTQIKRFFVNIYNYNGHKIIKRSLSYLDSGMDLVILDDHSTDESINILLEFIKLSHNYFQSITIIIQYEHRGFFKSYMQLFKYSSQYKGFSTYIDSDDILLIKNNYIKQFIESDHQADISKFTSNFEKFPYIITEANNISLYEQYTVISEKEQLLNRFVEQKLRPLLVGYVFSNEIIAQTTKQLQFLVDQNYNAHNEAAFICTILSRAKSYNVSDTYGVFRFSSDGPNNFIQRYRQLDTIEKLEQEAANMNILGYYFEQTGNKCLNLLIGSWQQELQDIYIQLMRKHYQQQHKQEL